MAATVSLQISHMVDSSDTWYLALWPNNTYKAMRIVSDEYNLFYSVWCTNQKELYDMTVSKESYRITLNAYDLANSQHSRSILTK